MRNKLFALLSVLMLVSLVLTACGPAATEPPIAATAQTIIQTQIVEVQVTAQPPANPERVIENVEDGAQITLWTFWLSPTFDDYIKGTIARFNEAYPGVKVNWEDHQATYLDDYRNAIAAGKQPDVANLSNGEGWTTEFATKGVLMQ